MNDQSTESESAIVVLIHDSPGQTTALNRTYENFYVWLRQAVDDMIEFDRIEDDAQSP